MGIRQLTDHGAKTAGGELVFFMIKPDNLSVLSGEGIRSRVKNLTDLLCGTQEVRLLALDSRESFQRNKDWYRQRLETEELPAIRELLRQDAAHLDEIQAATASAREFALVYRLDQQESGEDISRLRQMEQALRDLGFHARLASEQDVKRLLAVYYRKSSFAWIMMRQGSRPQDGLQTSCESKAIPRSRPCSPYTRTGTRI